MEKEEFLKSIAKNLRDILNDYRFNNYKNQIFAWRLSAEFKRKYDEGYLWNRALYLSSNGGILLSELFEKKLATRSLKESAEIYEYLSNISEIYDKEYAIILSALCYDIAGYQANALCLIKSIKDYKFESYDEKVETSSDNYIIYHIRQILSKNIFKARKDIDNTLNTDLGIKLFNNSIFNWYDNILNGTENKFLEEIKNVYKYYLNSSNLPISHLLFLLKTRVEIYLERSIWKNLLQDEVIRNNPVWKKYIKLLTNDIYDGNIIKDIDKRISKFEFWISQLRAIEKGILNTDKNFVIQMPTSAGKTFIAELTILNHLVKHPNKKCIYIAPFRALTNEKEIELANYLSKSGFSVSALSGSYEIDEFQEIILEDTDVLIATPEKIDLLLRLNPDYFKEISLIVVDEGHIIGDISPRSSLLEFLIIRLKIKIETIKVLFISAVMPPENADEYSIWLSGERKNVIRSLLYSDSSVEEEWEPTRKLIGSFIWDGNNGRINYKNVETEDEETKVKIGAFVPSIIKAKQHDNRFPKKDNKAETAVALAYKLANDGNCLIFCSQVRYTTSVAKSFLKLFKVLKDANLPITNYFLENTDKESYFYAAKWYGEDEDSYVSQCIKRGIGIHYGDMPESVRRSVELDYQTGKLRILISTNTIGQGINFPIKHLIIHSTIVDTSENTIQKITIRDFWNIIGRAGRASKETEGQVIFLINSYTDGESYEEYTKRENIESAYSMFFNVLNALLLNRISAETFETYNKILSEPYFLNLLMEETIESEHEKIIEKIINNSLFKIQAEKRNLDLNPSINSFKGILRKIKENVEDVELIKNYGKTGFNLNSNQSINNFINKHLDELKIVIKDDDYFSLLKLILKLFDLGEIEEITSRKLDNIGLNPSEYFPLIKKWIEGSEIVHLQEEWLKINDNIENLNIFISDGLYYRYTWAITSFITILLYNLKIDHKELPINIKNLASYVKFGVNSQTSCLACSLGIKNRNIAILLSDKSNNLVGRDFIRWVANLTIEDVEEFNISKYDKQNIINVALKLTPNRYNEMPNLFNFNIKGIPFEKERKDTSLLIKLGDVLSCQRDITNIYDPFAIKIFYNKKELGFVPKEYSKIIAPEIDLNNTEYSLKVIKTEDTLEYKKIYVEMTSV